MSTLIVCAVQQEAETLKIRLGTASTSLRESWGILDYFNDHDSWLMVTGMGAERATTAIKKALAQLSLTRIIVIGYSGALNDRMKTGQCYCCQVIHRSLDDKTFNASLQSDPTFTSTLDTLPGARLLTSEMTLKSIEQKAEAHEVFSCDLVDMESGWFVEAAIQSNTPWFVLRAVSDPHDMPLPSGLESLVKPDGTTDFLRALLFSLNRPYLIPRLIRLGKHSKMAGQTLADAVIPLLKKSR